MDNDDKVTHQSVRLFLGKELTSLEKNTKASPYNLIDEYAKTRKNKNYRVWLLLTLCFFVVFTASTAITLAVSHANSQIEINIASFDDLNLRTLLNKVGRTQSLYEEAAKKKASLESALKNSLQLAAQKRENDLFTMRSVAKLTSKRALKRKTEEVEEEYDAAVARLHESYDQQIEAAGKEMLQYASQLDSYDSEKITRAQEAEAAIDSQRQLHSLEMKNLTASYEKQLAELREEMEAQQLAAQKAQQAAVEEVRRVYQARIDELDPFVRDAKGNSLMRNSARDPAAPIGFSKTAYSAGSGKSGETLSKALADTEKAFSDFDYISGIVDAVPQEHDIPSFVQAMKNKTYEIGSTLASAAQNLQLQADDLRGQVSRLQEELEARNSTLEAYMTENLCDGLVLGSAGRGSFSVYMSKATRAKLSQGILAAQVREGKKVIADITLELQDEAPIARCQDSAQSAKITACAKIYLRQ